MEMICRPSGPGEAGAGGSSNKNKKTETSRKHNMKKQTLHMIGLATLLASAPQAFTQEQLATSMKEVRLEAGQTRDQLAKTLAALTTLTKQEKGDMRPAYEAFTAEVPKTEKAAATTRTRVAWMQGDGMKYFEDWQTTISSINNESLRKKSQKRLDAVKKSYGKVIVEFKEAAEKFKPLLADLNDIQKVLSTDLTAKGVKGLRSTVSSANWNYKSVNRTINSALEEMKDMEKELSPEAK
jgi:DNA-binding XRE family transcriptional regulator